MPNILVMDDLSERDIRADDGRVRRISLLLLRMEVQFVVLLSLLFCSSFVSISLTNIFGQM